MNILSALWILMAWSFSARASVVTVLSMHPCISSCLWVNNSMKYGWGTAGILQSTPPDWELQDRKWHLNSSIHKQKCLTLTTPALASWRPKNDVTMMCADLWRGYQRGLIIHYDAHARRFRKAQVISSSADLRWTHIGPRQEGLRGKVCEKVYHDKFINGRRDF